MPLPDTRDRTTARRRALRRLRSVLWRGRFVLAAVCCGLAAAAVVQAVRPEPPPTVDVVVPAHPLPAGEPVAAGDLTTVAVVADLAPDGVATDPAELVGRAPATRLPAGLPLHAGLLPGGGVVTQAPRGTVVVPVRLEDTTTGWLHPGDRVDLVVTGDAIRGGVATAADGAGDDDGYLARRALVLPRPAGGDPATGGLLGSATGSSQGAVTLVAVSPDEAAALSAASGRGTVGAVLVR